MGLGSSCGCELAVLGDSTGETCILHSEMLDFLYNSGKLF